MLYLMHCTFTQGGETPGHGYFTYLVGAPDAETAKERLRTKLDLARARGDLFDDPVEIFLEDVIEVSRAPKRGVIGRYQVFYGERPATISCSLPLSGSVACALAEPEDDEEDEPEGGVSVEPFVVYGSKGR